MDSFQNPVGGHPRDPYEGYRVDPVEKDKEAKENPNRSPNEPPEGKSAIGAYLLLLFKKIAELFVEGPEKGISSTVEKEVRENLCLLKAAFEILKTEDRSQDLPFLNRLSKLWQHALEDALRFQRDSYFSQQFKTLIQKIQNYPENQEHTFGFYLSEYAGQKWLPFPYMEMVQKIHAQYQKNPEGNPLSEWTVLIDELIVLLKSD